MLAVLLLSGCAAARVPAPALCTGGVCIVQSSRRDINRVCEVLMGYRSANCFDPYTRTAWISEADALSKDICITADSKADCEEGLFR